MLQYILLPVVYAYKNTAYPQWTCSAPQYLADFVQCSQSLNPAVDPVLGPSTLPTTSNPALVPNFENVPLVMLAQLCGILYLTKSDNIKLTTDTNRFKGFLNCIYPT